MRALRPVVVLALCIFFVHSAPAQKERSPDYKAGYLQFLKQFLREKVLKINEKDVKVAIALQELNKDGTPEAIVYWISSQSCGSGGCDAYIIQATSEGFRIVTRMTVTRPPIRMLETTSKKWHDLTVFVDGGGILPGYEALLQFDGKTYPQNPTVPPARRANKGASGKVLIRSAEDAFPLQEN